MQSHKTYHWQLIFFPSQRVYPGGISFRNSKPREMQIDGFRRHGTSTANHVPTSVLPRFERPKVVWTARVYLPFLSIPLSLARLLLFPNGILPALFLRGLLYPSLCVRADWPNCMGESTWRERISSPQRCFVEARCHFCVSHLQSRNSRDNRYQWHITTNDSANHRALLVVYSHLGYIANCKATITRGVLQDTSDLILWL